MKRVPLRRKSLRVRTKPKVRTKKQAMKMAKLDAVFSQIVRRRDGRCLRCHTRENLQCSHVIPKSASQFLRWDLSNAITLCTGCHLYWWHRYPHGAVEWFNGLFPGRHDELQARGRTGLGTKQDRVALYAALQAQLKERE